MENMLVYNGEGSWEPFTSPTEMLTVVFPAGFTVNSPVRAFSQLSKHPDKQNVALSGIINSVVPFGEDGGYKAHVAFPADRHFKFNAIAPADFKTISVEQCDDEPKAEYGTPKPLVLPVAYVDREARPAAGLFAGKLNWAPRAVNAQIVLVIPDASTTLFAVYYQLQDGDGQVENVRDQGSYTPVERSPDGHVLSGRYEGEKYTYEFTFDPSGAGEWVALVIGDKETTARSETVAFIRPEDFSTSSDITTSAIFSGRLPTDRYKDQMPYKPDGGGCTIV